MAITQKPPLLDKSDVLNGKWEIIDHIATGGMAEIYCARQLRLDRQVAVKILSEEFLSTLEGDEEEIQAVLERFHREVMVMAQVRHPNVLQVYDQDHAEITVHDVAHSIEYIVMEYIPGPNFRSTMPKEGFQGNEDRLIRWLRNYFLPILEGVEAIHDLGIVHRDLKPENVLLDGFIPKITDFGLAGGVHWRGVTQSHHIFGTVPYQAPEQFVDMAETDARADIYSLGKILYEAVSGKMTKETAFVFKTAHLSNPDTPILKGLDRVIRQATEEDKKDRISSVKVLRQALLDVLEETEAEQPESQMRRSTGKRIRSTGLILGILTVLIAGSVIFHVLYHEEQPSPPASTSQPSVSGSPGAPVPPAQESVPEPNREGRPPAPEIRAGDGASLRLIPGGETTVPPSIEQLTGKHLKVGSFYMDETEVTNHHYVQFLNQVLPRINMEGDAVKGDGQIWLLLGKVSRNYEPIVFKDGKFLIGDLTVHSNPVVRVTAYGAEAYAKYYGLRLPTEAEWLFVMVQGGVVEQSIPQETPGDSEINMDTGMMHMGTSPAPSPPPQPRKPVLAPVSLYLPNGFGIRGLAESVKEWTVQPENRDRKAGQFVILPSEIQRKPWEAFEDVGFRCVLSLAKRK